MSLFYVAMSRVVKVSAGPLGAKPTSLCCGSMLLVGRHQ